MTFDQETAETIAPVLAMIGQEARLDPRWTCHMLEAVNGQVLPGFHRQQRDTAASDAERIRCGMKLAAGPGASIDDLVQLAHSYASDEKLFDALYWVTKALGLEPGEGELLRFKASILERMGKFDQALRTAHEAKFNNADPECISSDIDRINKQRVALLREHSSSIDDATSLPAFAKLLGMGRLELHDLMKFVGKIIKSYAKRT